MALQLPDITITGTLHQSSIALILSAIDDRSGEPVLVKTPRAYRPPPQLVQQLRREYAITSRLADLPGVVKPVDLRECGSGSCALLLRPWGKSLRSLMDSPQWYDSPITDRLRIAIGVARALQDIHARRIVHTDVVPRNILVDPDSLSVQLTEFGLVCELSEEWQTEANANRIKGSLPYLSPEQTGRINRPLDYRSDFYSLGVCIFEMLTGVLPFKADSTMGWVHQHVSAPPPPVSSIASDLPAMLDAIVLRLLTKDAGSRYQHSQSIINDLQRVHDNILQGRPSASFQIAERDVSPIFSISQRLYGRESDLRTLLNTFYNSQCGAKSLCTVSGPSGSGKSALVRELREAVVRERGFFLEGKFQQFSNNTPLSAIGEIFSHLFRLFSDLSPQQEQQYLRQLKEVLGESLGVLLEFVPELGTRMGEVPEVGELPANEAQNRILHVLGSVLAVFANEQHPLVIFIDDLQWADGASIGFLKNLLYNRELSHLLLICAYRDNEITEHHPFAEMVAAVADRVTFVHLAVPPMPENAIVELIRDTLSTTVADATPLATALARKTGGNPFFVMELVKSLHENGQLVFDHREATWRYDLAGLERLDIPGNVVDFVLGNIQRLPADVLDCLQLAAVIGKVFTFDMLLALSALPMARIQEALSTALRHDFVAAIDSNYKFTLSADPASTHSNTQFRFKHDRIQQAAYSGKPDDAIAASHLKVAWYMQRCPLADDDRQWIALGNHVLLGASAIIAEERLDSARLLIHSAQAARAAGAYERAMEFVDCARKLVGTPDWRHEYTLLVALHYEFIHNGYQVGRYEDVEAAVAELHRNLTDREARAELFALQTRQLATMGRMADSITSAVEGLKLLGIAFNPSPTRWSVLKETAMLNWLRRGRPVAAFARLPPMRDRHAQVASSLLMEIFAAAFLSGQRNLLPYMVIKAVNLCLKYGNSPDAAFTYGAYGMVLCGVLQDPVQGLEYGKLALALNEAESGIGLKARVIYVYAMFIHHWTHPWPSLTPWFERGITLGRQSGDQLYLSYSAQDCILWDYTLSLPESEARQKHYLNIVRDCDYRDSLDSGSLYLQLVRNMMGKTDTLLSLSDAEFYEEDVLSGMHARNFQTGVANYQIYKIEILALYHEIESALSLVAKQDAMIFSSLPLPQYARYLLAANVVLSHPENKLRTTRAIQHRLKKDLRLVRKWARNCPENFAHMALFMAANLAACASQWQLAVKSYQGALAAAQRYQQKRDEGWIAEFLGRAHLSQGQPLAAEGYLRMAYHAFSSWGAARKSAHLREIYSQFDLAVGTAPESLENAHSDVLDLDAGTLDLTTIINATNAISQELNLQRLLQQLVRSSMEHSGAQRGLFIIEREGSQEIACNASHEEVGQQDQYSHFAVDRCLAEDQAIIVHSAADNARFASDPHIQRFQVRSLMCVPVHRSQGMRGVLYLENNAIAGAFDPRRVELVKVFAGQAAISIENAQLYEELEGKVQERTRQLSETLDKLTATQSHLIQAEKISSLGTLVAGVAHEINNPTNFARLAAVSQAEDISEFQAFVTELLGEENDAEISLAFEQRFARLLRANRTIIEGAGRIADIVKDLRTFSRLDESEVKSISIEENISSTLRLVEAQYRGNIEFLVDYTDRPMLDCLPAQLNQVLMNLLVNACQAVEQRRKGQSKDWQGMVCVSVAVVADEVRIDVKDNGVGMNDTVKNKIFEPFFTTKDVGTGTGMGMSICYQIVERHRGRFVIESDEGIGTTISLYLPLANDQLKPLELSYGA